MLIPSTGCNANIPGTSLSRRVNANSQQQLDIVKIGDKLIKKGEC